MCMPELPCAASVASIAGMTTLGWILLGGLLMSAIAMVGSITVLMREATLERFLLPLVAVAAGTMLGGAFFHMMPVGFAALEPLPAAAWLAGGFASFLALEQFLHWHHSHRSSSGGRQPVTYLILVGDTLHNFIGGIAIASTFLVSPQAGVIAWFAAAAHEIPQEIGDFAVLIHGGWKRRRALFWNAVSALSFPLGAVLAWLASARFDVTGLMLFGAGNFLYIAASDLIPEIKSDESFRSAALHFIAFAASILLMFGFAHWFNH